MPILFQFKAIIPIVLLTITEYCVGERKSMKRGKRRKNMSGTIFQIYENITCTKNSTAHLLLLPHYYIYQKVFEIS